MTSRTIFARFVAGLFALAVGMAAQAQCITDIHGNTLCPAPDARCVADRYGQWQCSGPGGDAVIDIHGNPVCGVGRCVSDINMRVMCSTESRGSAALDLTRQAVCTGSCAQASAGQCTALRK